MHLKRIESTPVAGQLAHTRTRGDDQHQGYLAYLARDSPEWVMYSGLRSLTSNLQYTQGHYPLLRHALCTWACSRQPQDWGCCQRTFRVFFYYNGGRCGACWSAPCSGGQDGTHHPARWGLGREMRCQNILQCERSCRVVMCVSECCNVASNDIRCHVHGLAHALYQTKFTRISRDYCQRLTTQHFPTVYQSYPKSMM